MFQRHHPLKVFFKSHLQEILALSSKNARSSHIDLLSRIFDGEACKDYLISIGEVFHALISQIKRRSGKACKEFIVSLESIQKLCALSKKRKLVSGDSKDPKAKRKKEASKDDRHIKKQKSL